MEAKNKSNNIPVNTGKRRSTFAVLFYINRTKIRKDGMCQVLCRISIDALWEQVGTKIFIDPNVWDAAAGRATGRTRNALNANEAIGKMEDRIRNHYEKIQVNLGFVTAQMVKNAVSGVGQAPLTLMKLFEEHNNEFLKRVGVDRNREAYDVYNVTRKHLWAFLRQKMETEDVSLRSLNLDFYDAFDLFLRTDKGLGQKTIHQHLYNLKKISRLAVNQGTLRRDPFHSVRPEMPPLRSRHLKMEDLERLMQYPLEKLSLQRVRDWFVFSTFTGLAYVDLNKLSEENIVEAADGSLWIYIKRSKTGTEARVRLLDIPLRIIEKYRHERTGDKIFNLYCRNYTIKLTKKLGKVCGIGDVTFHKARHNFGTLITLSQGVPIETVSRMMGHKNISTTQIYAKVTDKKVDEDMKRLAKRTAGKTSPLYEDEALRAAIRFPGSNRKKQTDTQIINN